MHMCARARSLVHCPLESKNGQKKNGPDGEEFVRGGRGFHVRLKRLNLFNQGREALQYVASRYHTPMPAKKGAVKSQIKVVFHGLFLVHQLRQPSKIAPRPVTVNEQVARHAKRITPTLPPHPMATTVSEFNLDISTLCCSTIYCLRHAPARHPASTTQHTKQQHATEPHANTMAPFILKNYDVV